MSDARVTGDVTLAQIVQAAADAIAQRGEQSDVARAEARVALAAVLPLIADAIADGQIADRRERTAEVNQAREAGNDDEPCQDSTHLECHMAAAFAGWGEAARLVRRLGDADPADLTVSDGRAVRDA